MWSVLGLGGLFRALFAWLLLYIGLIHLWVAWRWEAVDVSPKLTPLSNPTESPSADTQSVLEIDSELEDQIAAINDSITSLKKAHRGRIETLKEKLEEMEEALKVKSERQTSIKAQEAKLNEALDSLKGLELPYFIDGPDLPDLENFQEMWSAPSLLTYDEEELSEHLDEIHTEWQEVLMTWESLDWTKVSSLIQKRYTRSAMQCPRFPNRVMAESTTAGSSAERWATDDDLVKELKYLREVIQKRRSEQPLKVVTNEGTYEKLEIWRERHVQAWVDQHLDDFFNEVDVVQHQTKAFLQQLKSITQQGDSGGKQGEATVVAGNCDLSPEETLPWLEAGLEAQSRGRDLNQAILTAVASDGHSVDDVILDAVLDPVDDEKHTILPPRQTINLRRVLDRPFTKNIATYVDHVVDGIGGWITPLDPLLDKVPEDLQPFVDNMMNQAGLYNIGVPEWVGRHFS